MISSLTSAGIVSADASSDVRQAVTSHYHKIRIADAYRPASQLHASTHLTLVRASDSLEEAEPLGEDYGLSSVYEGQVDVHVLEGTHQSIVADDDKSTQLARLIDTVLSSHITP